MAIATGTAAALATIGAGALAAGGQVYGSKKQSSSNNRAMDIQAKADAEALALARENEARRRQEYDQMIAAEKAQWEAEEARMAPYRSASLGILGGAADRLGYKMDSLSVAPSSGKLAGKSKAPTYVEDSIGGLSGLDPLTPPIEPPEPEPMTLANLGRMRSAGDWRTGRRVM